MIDHVLGRPSIRFRKYQVFTVVLLWSVYLSVGDRHGPRPVRKVSEYLTKRLTTWRTVVIFCLSLYVSRNFARVVGLESPEPLANLYTRNYFRATWVTTALDAGFWTAMHMRPKWLKDLASVVFTLYYLVCAEQADEMVRKVRGGLTLEHLRVSWDKPKTPYISAVTRLMRPRALHRVKPRQLRIPRPHNSSYKEPISAWLYFDGQMRDLKNHDKVVLDIPGGGFVAMDPRCHDDKLLAWAARTGLPVLALDYKKAPEYPFPYALNECYDAYHTLITSHGRCIGLEGSTIPKIVLSGDSAGGNLAVGLILMLLQDSPHSSYFPGDQRKQEALPLPEALVAVYPALDMNISNWMTDEQMALIKAPERRQVNKGVLRQKSDNYRRLTPDTPHGSDDEDEGLAMSALNGLKRTKSSTRHLLGSEKAMTKSPTTTDPEPKKAASKKKQVSEPKPQPLPTRLAMSSMISYFNDRVLSPEMLRAMIILYIGPYGRPDFATDYQLSPVLAPEQLLARFPKVYLLTGERDPLVDDTVIFAGRLRQAHWQKFRERQELGLIPSSERFDENKYVEVNLIPGISHGFLQFVSVYHDGWKYIFQCSRWMKDAFREADAREAETPAAERRAYSDYFTHHANDHASKHSRASSFGDEDRPLEMSSINLQAGAGERGRRKTGGRHGRGQIQKYSGRKSPIATRRSLVRLASTEDLMGRRMHGLTGNLMGGSMMEPKTP
ncbi:alpha/beta-hydrolase [Teratosphaeria nubilosa]|uniref:Alpha/beta-hydrolase n=1 Tax=Teratosphaeria nubilosa TaxID=161662 RepID=A0A6G1L0Z3_9PEZI|nr:alpha/beta-hydrolase [Teratosphaeria nubilosa]